MSGLKKTPLYSIHSARNARLVPFAGYSMPVQYQGVVAEHRAVREKVGLFDVSHMGEVAVRGDQALDGLQWVVTNDLSKIEDGQAQYALMCRADGGIVDDIIVYRKRSDDYLLCVNASRREEDLAHLRRELGAYDCEVTDESERYAQLALQGPQARALLEKVLPQQEILAGEAFRFWDGSVGDIGPVRVARTGYTGEWGVELYCASEDAADLWTQLEEVGKACGLVLCGLGARDTLRLEMRYLLYGQDMDETHHPWEAGLGWLVKLAKTDFLGKQRLQSIKEQGFPRRLVGFELRDRGIARPGYELAAEGKCVGTVTSGSHSPSLGLGIGLGYVPAELSRIGTRLSVMIRDRPVAAEVVKTPFYRRKR